MAEQEAVSQDAEQDTEPAHAPAGGATEAPAENGQADLPDWARAELAQARRDAAKYRTRAKELEPFEKKAREAEEASKSEIERATEKLTVAERRAVEAEARAMRLEVASSKGLTPKQAARLVGSTVEELEADADELLSSFTPNERPAPPRQPQENLRGGGDPTELPEETDPRKVAAQIPRY